MYFIQHCFICRPSDYTVPEDDGIEIRTVATLALAVRCSLTTGLDLIHTALCVYQLAEAGGGGWGLSGLSICVSTG